MVLEGKDELGLDNSVLVMYIVLSTFNTVIIIKSLSDKNCSFKWFYILDVLVHHFALFSIILHCFQE